MGSISITFACHFESAFYVNYYVTSLLTAVHLEILQRT